ncbi:hypothetical protein [Caballeronia sp. GAFFF2]|uniref:hypothetical protein n=1 Tax=Caballeronia sp. GAFFF2 TaxID=2921741 RepID=UPI0020281012|nr:hypothetical protein [Caballeronia sp. GAFFF2]
MKKGKRSSVKPCVRPNYYRTRRRFLLTISAETLVAIAVKSQRVQGSFEASLDGTYFSRRDVVRALLEPDFGMK